MNKYEYPDYNNDEVRYEKKPDPREINVVEMIQTHEQRLSDLPRLEDDHVCLATLQKYVGELESEVAVLKNDKFSRALKDAISVGGTIVLEGNVDLDTALVLDKDVTLDLNGRALSISKDTVGDGVFHITDGTLVINGNGCINGVGNNDYNMAIWADGGNVVINGGTFTNEGAIAKDDPAHMDLIYAKNGSVVEICGGFFKCATPKWTLNKHDSTDSTILVSGGTFVNYDPSHSETENPVANFVADGYKVVAETKENGDIWYTVVAE